jgi:hypothetical protein
MTRHTEKKGKRFFFEKKKQKTFDCHGLQVPHEAVGHRH